MVSKVDEVYMLNNEDRYKHLIDARNYHFTQYNIWMAFFIGINSALFVAYYSLLKENYSLLKENYNLEKIVILLFGYIAAFLFYCSAKGYHYWINNFVNLLIDYENKNVRYDNDRVYSCIASKKNKFSYFKPLKAANISTFKIVILFAYLLTYGWGILLMPFIDKWIESCQCLSWLLCLPLWLQSIIIIFIVNVILLWFAKRCLKSNLKNYKDLELSINDYV